jgi:hypothetical protein
VVTAVRLVIEGSVSFGLDSFMFAEPEPATMEINALHEAVACDPLVRLAYLSIRVMYANLGTVAVLKSDDVHGETTVGQCSLSSGA